MVVFQLEKKPTFIMLLQIVVIIGPSKEQFKSSSDYVGNMISNLEIPLLIPLRNITMHLVKSLITYKS